MTPEALQAKVDAIRARATAAQQQAADPAKSVWVSANAGTGKTRVLTNRILRLLVGGAKVTDILAVTYTRTAAQEMRNRVFETLAEWAVMTGSELDQAIVETGISRPSEKQRQRARMLFAALLDQPVGLRIETVHAFSQSILRRFPVEAGIQPYFELATEVQSTTLKQDATARLLGSHDSLVKEAISAASARYNLDQLLERISDFSDYPDNLEALRAAPLAVKKQLFEAFDVSGNPDTARQRILASARPGADRAEELRRVIEAIENHGTDSERMKKSPALATFLHCEDEVDEHALHHYASQFLTQAGTVAKTLLTKAVVDHCPRGVEVMTAEAERLITIYQHLHGYDTAEMSFHLLVLAETLFRDYQEAKRKAGLMDYDDLIRTTYKLLAADGGAAWVRYKLDRGINHVLIDEAQDTSPQQWQIMATLAEAFFSGDEEDRDGKPPRSLFSVGDYKQSIYSFQGARPELFDRQENDFRAMAHEVRKPFERIDLDTSFRTVTPVLKLVDAVMQARLDTGQPALPGVGLSADHIAVREGQGGFVEVMDLVSKDDHGNEAKHVAARQIVQVLQSWIGRRMLPARGRVMTAGDILILLRDRTPGGLYHVLDRELRRAGLPVAGSDRILLSDDIAVRDLLALGRAVLVPEDDLTLATVLKSPLFGLTEDDLFRLAYDRGKRTLQARLAAMATDDPIFARAHDRFSTWLELAERRSAHSFFSTVLSSEIRQNFARRLGNYVGDVLAEFLEISRQYEIAHPSSLLGFIEEVEKAQTQIKREGESRPQDEIRIMTIHSAKGLEAPVVVLPDTLYAPSKSAAVTPARGSDGRAMPVIQLAGRCPHPLAAEAAADAKKRNQAEADRLFYVAMTRAEDGLLVAGFESQRRKREGSWYDAVSAAMARVDDQIANHDLTISGLARAETVSGDNGIVLMRLEASQILEPKVEKASPEEALPLEPPGWLGEPAPPEETPPRPLSPSRYAVAEPPRSPVGDDRRQAMERGVLAHRMFEILPGLKEDARRKAAARIMDAGLRHLSRSAAETVLEQVLGLIDSSELAEIFSPNARAEVPVSGLVGKTVVSGVIDRLVVTDDRITLIDFKTGTPPADGVPNTYISQMALYRHLTAAIWPGREVAAGLLYTEDASLHWLDPAAMDAVVAELMERS